MSEDTSPKDAPEPATAADPDHHTPVPRATTQSYWYQRHVDLPPNVETAPVGALAERPRSGGLRRASLIIGTTAVLALGAGFGGGLLSAHTSSSGATATDT